MVDGGTYPDANPPFDTFVSGIETVKDFNRNALGAGWRLAEEMADLHREAMVTLSRQAGPHSSIQEEAVFLLGTHAFNLLTASMGEIVRGQFDVAMYLVRPLFDTAALILACGLHPDLAAKYRRGQFSAADARRQHVADLEAAGDPELATDIDRMLREEASAANIASHPGLVHADKLLAQTGNIISPTLGGRPDAAQAVLLARTSLLYEQQAMMWLRTGQRDALAGEWSERFDELSAAFLEWMAATDER